MRLFLTTALFLSLPALAADTWQETCDGDAVVGTNLGSLGVGDHVVQATLDGGDDSLDRWGFTAERPFNLHIDEADGIDTRFRIVYEHNGSGVAQHYGSGAGEYFSNRDEGSWYFAFNTRSSGAHIVYTLRVEVPEYDEDHSGDLDGSQYLGVLTTGEHPVLGSVSDADSDSFTVTMDDWFTVDLDELDAEITLEIDREGALLTRTVTEAGNVEPLLEPGDYTFTVNAPAAADYKLGLTVADVHHHEGLDGDLASATGSTDLETGTYRFIGELDGNAGDTRDRIHFKTTEPSSIALHDVASSDGTHLVYLLDETNQTIATYHLTEATPDAFGTLPAGEWILDMAASGTETTNYDLTVQVGVIDRDGDGTVDADDGCPDDPAKACEGDCGCAVPDVDADFDGFASCVDCADDDADWNPDTPEVCDGIDDNCDGVADDGTLDTDVDGVCDEMDICPLDIDDDSDGDGICDSDDFCALGDDTLDADGDLVPDACDLCRLDDAYGDSDVDGICDFSFADPGYMVPGGSVTFELANGAPGANAKVFVSAAGEGAGPCAPASIGGACLGIRNPIELGTVALDDAGAGSLTITVPATAASGTTVWFQAIWGEPGSSETSAVFEDMVDYDQ